MNLRKNSLCVGALVCVCSLALFATDKRECELGKGEFKKKVDGWKVRLEPGVDDQFGQCRLRVLGRKDVELFGVSAPYIRVDVTDVDLNGDGVKDLAFEAGPSPRSTCCSTYSVVSLGDNPHLLRKIEHGQFFSLADRDNNQVPEIWAADAEVFEGFDGLVISNMPVLPTVVMRLEREKLINAGPEFLMEFESLVGRVRSQLTAERIQAFRASDGKLAGQESDPKLRDTKALVLALAWMYLSNGREQEARKALEELWPPSDVDRIRTLIEQKQAAGVLAQTDATAAPVEATGCDNSISPPGVYRVGGGVTAPRAVFAPDPEYSEKARAAKYQGTVVLWLVIGCDGNPHGIRLQRSLGMGLDEKAIEAVRQWKFEPARRNGAPVAVQINVEVSFRLYN